MVVLIYTILFKLLQIETQNFQVSTATAFTYNLITRNLNHVPPTVSDVVECVVAIH